MAIYITDLRHIHSYDVDLRFAIMRSFSGMDKVTQLAELSPSWRTFKIYRDLANAGNWNKNTFNEQYLPNFLMDMRQPEAVEALGKVLHLYKIGLNVALACCCPIEDLCHRSVVAGILKGLGCNVITDTGTDYIQYYDMWRL